MNPIIKGKIYFQPRERRKSIRCRGKDALKWNKKNRNGKETLMPKNRTDPREDINYMEEYSARKKYANDIPENSVMKPDTRSDSDSAKSKGARFNSITAEMANSMATGKRGNAKAIFDWLCNIGNRSTLPTVRITISTI